MVERQAAVYNQQVVQNSTAETAADGSTVYVHRNPQATVHYVVGTGGASFSPNVAVPTPSWSEMNFFQWGYAKVTAHNASYLDWQWVNNSNNAVLDHMVIMPKISPYHHGLSSNLAFLE